MWGTDAQVLAVLRNTEKNPYSENLLYPKNEVQALTSHHIQRDRADELNPLIFAFHLKKKKGRNLGPSGSLVTLVLLFISCGKNSGHPQL